MAVAACRLGWEDGRCTDPRVAVGGGGQAWKRRVVTSLIRKTLADAVGKAA